MDLSSLLSLEALDKLSTFIVLCAVALSVITDRLVWHTRVKEIEARATEALERAERRADRWEQVALDALMAGAQAGVRAAETAVDVVSALPDPAKLRGD